MISFIIPAYNSSKTIKRALDSIFNQKQTILEYEIIIVDDGSKDNLKDIIEEYKNTKTKDLREKIKYFEKKNSGVADTRNYGVEKASGEYIIFVDSDDYISDTLLKDIQEYILKKIDLIKWNPVFVDEELNTLKKNIPVTFNNLTGEQGFNKLFGKDNLIDCLWNYAIKKDIMLKFPEKTYHEDFAVMPLIILKAKTFVSIDKYEYYYVQTKNSIMREKNSEKTRRKLQDKLNHYDNLIKQSEKMNLEKLTKENLAIFATNSLIAVISELDKENKKEFEKGLKKRKVAKNIKVRNIKQLIKRLILEIKY